MKLTDVTQNRLRIPTRELGTLDYNVGIISLGGQGLLESHGDEKNCIKIIRRAYELGINYFDTSPVYGQGTSHEYYGKALKGIRDKVFLATKTHKRDRDGSLRLLEKSLKVLKTDHIDLWQIHHLDTMEDVDKATAKKDSALNAMLEMQAQQVVRYLGITGHSDPKVLLEAMKRHNFDTVLCPVNAADVHMHPSFIKTVLPAAKERGMAVIGMKCFAQGHIFDRKGLSTAYEALTYAFSQPISTIIVGCDNIAQLEENVAIAKSFSQLSKRELKEIESKTEHYTRRACFFRDVYGGYDSIKKLGPPPVVTKSKH